jgi:hypothetical protein
MRDIVHTYAAGQGRTSLAKQSDLQRLAAEIKNAHARTASAFSKAIEHALAAGRALIAAKPLVPHGGWLQFLDKNCDLDERRAQRYIQLARRYDAANATCKSQLIGLSIEAAIKQLSLGSEKDIPRREVRTAPKQEHNGPAPTGLDILELWNRAPLMERTKFVNQVGLDALLHAIPTDWMQTIEMGLRNRRTSAAPSNEYLITETDGYPDLPDSLRRSQPTAEEGSTTQT